MMKPFIAFTIIEVIFAIVGVIATSVSAHGPRGDWRGGEEDRRGLDRRGDLQGYRDSRNWGKRGYHGQRDDRGYWKKSVCECSNQCQGNTGSKSIGCFRSRAEYLQCQDSTCTKQSCPDKQLFNFTSKACESCPTGYHVDANKHRCVCDQGTTFDWRTRRCVACPTGAVVTADSCQCESSVWDKANNNCRQCPEGSTQRGRHCVCNDRQLFWNHSAFQCQVCPGVWTSVAEGSYRRQRTGMVCKCEGENQIFNKWSVSCITCPANSVVATKRGKTYCDCPMEGERYDWKTNKCVNKTSDDDDHDDDEPAEVEDAPSA